MRDSVDLFSYFLSLHFSHLPGHISGEVAVRSKLQVAAVPGGVVHHVDLS